MLRSDLAFEVLESFSETWGPGLPITLHQILNGHFVGHLEGLTREK